MTIGVLSTVDWDVERAAEMIFGGGASPATAGPSANANVDAIAGGYEEMELDDSEQGELLRPRNSVCVFASESYLILSFTDPPNFPHNTDTNLPSTRPLLSFPFYIHSSPSS